MSGQQPFYPQVQGSPADYKTYAIASPVETHTREGTCEEAGCLAWQNGWVTRVDTGQDLGHKQFCYLDSGVSGRTYTLTWESPTMAVFTFAAGQSCFASPHRVALERPAFFIVRDGDFRGNPRGTDPVARSVDDWVDDFANHQINLKDQIEKG